MPTSVAVLVAAGRGERMGAARPKAFLPLAGRLHLKDARLLLPEHALGFVRSLERGALAAGAAAMVVGLLARSGRAWAIRIARRQALVVIGAAFAGFLLGTPYAAIDPNINWSLTIRDSVRTVRRYGKGTN